MNGILKVWFVHILTLAYRFAFSFKFSKELESYATNQLVDFSPNLIWDIRIIFSFFKSILPCFKQVIATPIFSIAFTQAIPMCLP